MDRPSSAFSGSLLLCAILSALSSFNFGYNLSNVNTTAKTFRNCPLGSDTWDCFPVDQATWGWVAGILCLGALIGSLITGKLTEKAGRKNAVLCTSIPYIIGYLLLIFSQNLPVLLAGRIFIGIGIGIACIAVPIYLTEISPVADRGVIGSSHQMGISIGFLVGEVVPLFGLYKDFYWRVMFGIGLIPCIIQIFGMLFFASESPRYLIQRNEEQKGKDALIKLRGNSFDEDEYLEICQLHHSGSKNQDSASWSITDLLYKNFSVSYRSVIVAAVLHLGQQFSGINSVLLFSDSIFNENPSSNSSSISNYVPLFIAILNLILTIAAISVIDRAGRRFLALVSSALMFTAGFALTAAFYMKLKIVAIISVLVFVGGFAFGMGPVPWLMTSELFPTQAVSSAVSFAVAVNWVSNFIVTTSFPFLSSKLGDFTLFPYSVIVLLFFIFALKFLPETKGRPVAFV